jgi:uncharacterized protein YdhG (YjbR/CyaY superfamily)
MCVIYVEEMLRSTAGTVREYLESLPEDRRKTVAAVREVVNSALPDAIVETMRWGMISYEIPMELSGKTYNGQPLLYAAIASQKNHLALYLTGPYMDEQLLDRLRQGFATAGKRLDMGKSCLRFKRLEDIDVESIKSVLAAFSVQSFLAAYKITTTRA